MSIRVVLVDDHTLFRMGLAELLDQYDDLEVAGVAANGEEAKEIIAGVKPDVILMDLNLPPTSGIFLVADLIREGLTAPILMLTVSDDDEDLAAAMRAGARGYLLKDMQPQEVVDAIRKSVVGETVVAPSLAKRFVNLVSRLDRGRSSFGLLDSLTQRETEILSHLALGESNKVIARALAISHDTVKLHVRHILAKLKLTSRVEAAVFAVEHKIALTHAMTRIRPRHALADDRSRG